MLSKNRDKLNLYKHPRSYFLHNNLHSDTEIQLPFYPYIGTRLFQHIDNQLIIAYLFQASALSKELQSRLEEKSLAEQELREKLGREREERDRIERENEEYKFELELARNEIKSLKQRISTVTTEILTVNTEFDATKVKHYRNT